MRGIRALGVALVASAAGAMLATGGLAQDPGAKAPVGFLYRTTNGEGTNLVVRMARYGDGTLGDERTYSTNVRGGANHMAPTLGDYDARGQTQTHRRE